MVLSRLRDEETQLRKFTECYSKEKSIKNIPEGELKHWAKLTAKTEGQYIPKYMTADLWADSIGSLKTAVAILVSYTPERSAAAQDRWPTTLTELRQRILRLRKPKVTIRKQG